MRKKYILRPFDIIDESYSEHKMYKLISIKDFYCGTKHICKGEIGGIVESEDNLSHDGNCWINKGCAVFGKVRISENAFICNNVILYGDAYISGDVEIGGFIKIGKKALIQNTNDYISVGPIGSRKDYTTFYRTKDGKIWVSCGCFNDTIENFTAAVKETHTGTLYEKEYTAAISYAMMIFASRREQEERS